MFCTKKDLTSMNGDRWWPEFSKIYDHYNVKSNYE